MHSKAASYTLFALLATSAFALPLYSIEESVNNLERRGWQDMLKNAVKAYKDGKNPKAPNRPQISPHEVGHSPPIQHQHDHHQHAATSAPNPYDHQHQHHQFSQNPNDHHPHDQHHMQHLNDLHSHPHHPHNQGPPPMQGGYGGMGGPPPPPHPYYAPPPQPFYQPPPQPAYGGGFGFGGYQAPMVAAYRRSLDELD